MSGAPTQGQAAIRFAWGLREAQAAGTPDAAFVIVDVLSFSTAVTVAVGRGTTVYPHAWPDPGIEAFAAARDAAPAVPRRDVDAEHPWSLSPAHLLAASAPERLVLPSPNGSAISAALAAGQVVAGCLRNATAVARWLETYVSITRRHPSVIVAAGERWPGGALRPALEDLLGAGAIIAAIDPRATRSPEAAATEAAWRGCAGRAGELLRDCTSGQELAAIGYAADVAVAAGHDAEDTVPVLADGAYRDGRDDRDPSGG
jgi:2-phosphosulfolactate phosphatase